MQQLATGYDDGGGAVDEANAYVEGSVFSSQSGPVPWRILEAVPRDPGSGDDDLTRKCAQCAPSCSPQSPYAHAICYRPLLPKLWWREGLQPREGSTVRAKILPKKHKTFYFPASSELFLAR